jgi:hypothetical protein
MPLTARSGVDFDDDEIGFHEEGKPHIKVTVMRFSDSCYLIFVNQRENESFFHKFTAIIPNSIMGTLSFALEEVRKPEVKETRSSLIGNILRLGDPENNPREALEIAVKTSKSTALARPKTWKRFAPRESNPADEMVVDSAPTRDHDGDEGATKTVWAQLKMRTEFHVEHDEQGDENNENEEDMDVDVDDVKKSGAKVEKEQLIRGFKYGSSYVPCPDGQFAKLNTYMGISICGFFSADNVSLPLLFIHCTMTPCSFGESIPSARYNTCGQILVRPIIKLRSRHLSGLWTSSTCMQSPAGFLGTTRNQRWVSSPHVDFRKSTAFSGCRSVLRSFSFFLASC